MSDSVRPQRRQPTRLPHPWDSPGKNTGMGCHFLLQCMKVKSESEVAQSCPTLSDPMHCSLPGSSVHEIFQARVLEWGAIAFSEDRTVSEKKKKLGGTVLWQGLSRQRRVPVPFKMAPPFTSRPQGTGVSKVTGAAHQGLITVYIDNLCYTLEKAMAPHSSTLAWKIPWTEEPGGLQSMGSLRVRHD